MIKEWLTLSDIAILSGCSKSTSIRDAQREGWPYRSYAVRGGQERRYHIKDLPEDIQAAYAVSLNLTLDALQTQLKPPPKVSVKATIDGYKGRSKEEKPIKTLNQCTEAEREIARNRQKIIDAYSNSGLSVKRFIELYNDNLAVPDIKERLERWGHIGSTAVFYQNWLRRYQQFGLAGLVPQYKKRGLGASLSQDVKDLLEYLYLDTNQPGVADVVRHIQQVYGHEEVSEITARRYLMSIPQAVRVVWRKGAAALETVQPSIQRDYTLYKPMEIIVGDYMTQDFMLRYNDKVCRAKVVAFMDMRTRAIVGWSLQLTANSTGVAIALQKCFDRYGLPEYIYFDNGREFKNHFLCGDVWKTRSSVIDAEDIGRNIGVVVEAGVKLIFANPYNAKAKPIERFWRTLHDAFDRWQPSYVGSNTLLSTDESKVYRQNIKKMKQEDFDQIPEFKEVETMLAHFFAYYNHEHQHTGQGMDGKAPMQVWAEHEVPKREVPAELKPYLFTHRYTRTVGKNGISFEGGLYYADKVIQYLGQQVQIRVPLDRDDLIYVFSPEGEKLFDAVYLEEGTTVKEKIENVGKLKKQNVTFIKGYNKHKDKLDKQELVTVAETFAREHPELVEQEMPALQVVNGEPLTDSENNPELKLVKNKLIKLFK
ncbi:hypothetical protein Holit_01759 [Hollandina sp. SP2]